MNEILNQQKLKKLISRKINLIVLILILSQVQNLISQYGATGANSWMDNQTVIGNQTTMGVQSDAAYNAQPITTASPSTIPLAADDPGASSTPTAPTGFVSDTAGASYISGIDAAPAGAPAGATDTTPGGTPTPKGATGKPTTGPISTNVADLVKVAPADAVANLCAAASIVGDIPGCESTTDTSAKPTGPGPVPGAKKAGPVGAIPSKPGGPTTKISPTTMPK